MDFFIFFHRPCRGYSHWAQPVEAAFLGFCPRFSKVEASSRADSPEELQEVSGEVFHTRKDSVCAPAGS